MKITAAFLLVGSLFVLASASAAGRAGRTQTLCGWFDNPTPGNAWLHDRSGEWTIGIQGGHQADGAWPEFSPSQWVAINRSYGYGCACITGVVNGETREVIRIDAARTQPLGTCRKDRALKEPAD